MKKRRNHDAGFTARVALEAVQGERTLSAKDELRPKMVCAIVSFHDILAKFAAHREPISRQQILWPWGKSISSIRSIDLRLIDDLVAFVRGPGFVLDFSDSSFSDFFALELEINIDDPKYAANGGSKGKRLRYFLQTCDDATAVRALSALWEYRFDYLARSGVVDLSLMPKRIIRD